jgi:hypothetical protein
MRHCCILSKFYAPVWQTRVVAFVVILKLIWTGHDREPTTLKYVRNLGSWFNVKVGSAIQLQTNSALNLCGP